MRILITTRFYRNGQTTHVLTLCHELSKQGHEVFLVISQLDCANYAQWLKRRGIPFSNRDPLRLTRFFKRWQPQLIHNHSSQTLAASLKLAEILQIPSLTTVHYLDFAPLELLQKQAAIIVISREMQEQFDLAVPTYLLENGIPIPPEPKGKIFRQRALFLAQSTPKKAANFTAMAEALVAWGWEVRIAGNWRAPGAKALGWVNDIWPLLNWANLVVGTGRAVREGMAAACAAWVLGEYSDGLVTSGNATILLNTNYSGRCSKKAFRLEEGAAYLKNPAGDFFLSLGRFGRQYAQKYFSLQHKVHRLTQIYNAILAAPSICETGNLEIMSNTTRKGGISYETGDYCS